jgi:rubrerythrin
MTFSGEASIELMLAMKTAAPELLIKLYSLKSDANSHKFNPCFLTCSANSMSSMFGDSSLNYYCMSCGTKHKEAACPKCGSKMKRVGS